MTPKATCYHICYDAETKAKCPEEFQLLYHDNSRPEFFEIFPIYQALKEHSWQEDEFVGFFSPRFKEKTQFEPHLVVSAVDSLGYEHDVIMFSSFRLDCMYWFNVWEQGELCNPGVLDCSENLAQEADLDVDFFEVCTSLENTVFSHYLIARKPFWDEWMRLTEIYLQMIERDRNLLDKKTRYKKGSNSVHPFVVERFPTLIILTQRLNAHQFRCETPYKRNDPKRQNFWRMNSIKNAYLHSGEIKYLQEYWRIRSKMSLGRETAHARYYLNKE